MFIYVMTDIWDGTEKKKRENRGVSRLTSWVQNTGHASPSSQGSSNIWGGESISLLFSDLNKKLWKKSEDACMGFPILPQGVRGATFVLTHIQSQDLAEPVFHVTTLQSGHSLRKEKLSLHLLCSKIVFVISEVNFLNTEVWRERDMFHILSWNILVSETKYKVYCEKRGDEDSHVEHDLSTQVQVSVQKNDVLGYNLLCQSTISVFYVEKKMSQHQRNQTSRFPQPKLSNCLNSRLEYFLSPVVLSFPFDSANPFHTVAQIVWRET